MTTQVVPADAAGRAVAVAWLLQGGVAVLPTDTVYGLAARPADDAAVRAVFGLKERPGGMHLPVLAATPAQVRSLGVAFTHEAEVLAGRWWPGPLTLAFGFDARRHRPAWLEGRDEVAVRIPAHDFLRALLQETGPLLVTSANPHGAPTPRTAHEVLESLGDAVPLVVDGGALHDTPSTLVNVNLADPVVEREGAISSEAVSGALGRVP